MYGADEDRVLTTTTQDHISTMIRERLITNIINTAQLQKMTIIIYALGS